MNRLLALAVLSIPAIGFLVSCDDLDYTDPGTSVAPGVACQGEAGADVACRTEPEVRVRSPRAASSSEVTDEAVPVDSEWAVLATLGGRASVIFSSEGACSLAQDETDEQARLVTRRPGESLFQLTSGVAHCVVTEPVTVSCDRTSIDVTPGTILRLACNTDELERVAIIEGSGTVATPEGTISLAAGQELVRIPAEGLREVSLDADEEGVLEGLRGLLP